MTGPRVLVTRPLREAQRWVQTLQARGIEASALPLLAIEPLQVQKSLRQLREVQARAGEFDAWMFVSSAAVSHFMPDGQTASGPRCWATGPGTAAALREAGVPDSRIDAPSPAAGQFDSEALWPIVRGQIGAGSRVLFVRGGDASGQAAGRDWLSLQVADTGAAQETVVVYRRVPPSWGEVEHRLAQAASSDGSLWLFSSSQAIANLLLAVPQVDWSQARAIATHPRIAQAATSAGFGQVHQAPAGLDALVASIESFQ